MTSEELLSGTREFAVVSIRLLTDLEEGERKGSDEIKQEPSYTCTLCTCTCTEIKQQPRELTCTILLNGPFTIMMKGGIKVGNIQ